MKLIFVLLSIFFLHFDAVSQKASPDFFKTESGDLKIQPVLHGSLVLEWQDEVIYIDPFGGEAAYSDYPEPTIIMFTDIHGDHLNFETLDVLRFSQTTVVCPEMVARKLPRAFQRDIRVMNNGNNLLLRGIKIEAIPMYNLPESSDSRHPKGRGNGYVIEVGNRRIYVSGDTEDIVEMRTLKNIDVAFICMNLPYTMDVTRAADAVLEFQPKVVYPFHYRGQDELSNIAEFKSLVQTENPLIDVRLRNWYPEYTMASSTN